MRGPRAPAPAAASAWQRPLVPPGASSCAWSCSSCTRAAPNSRGLSAKTCNSTGCQARGHPGARMCTGCRGRTSRLADVPGPSGGGHAAASGSVCVPASAQAGASAAARGPSPMPASTALSALPASAACVPLLARPAPPAAAAGAGPPESGAAAEPGGASQGAHCACSAPGTAYAPALLSGRAASAGGPPPAWQTSARDSSKAIRRQARSPACHRSASLCAA